jgi:two-component system, OmpR family, sensor histidine kinase KdpD
MKTQNKIRHISAGKQYFFATIILYAFILLLYNFQELIGYQTVSLILLLVIFLMPLFNFEKGPIILAAVISALAWDYYFIPPHFTMHIADTEDAVMLFMFFIVALTNGVLTSRLKSQKDKWRKKEYRAASLYGLLKSLANQDTIEKTCEVLVSQISKTFKGKAIIYFPENLNKIKRDPEPCSNFKPDEMEWLAAEAAFAEKKEAGRYTDNMNVVSALYYPVVSNDSALCVIGVSVDLADKNKDEQISFLREYLDEASFYIKKQIANQNYSIHS